MITTGKLTGEVKDDFYVQVEMLFGVKRWVKPVFPFPLMGLPHKKWVEANKNKFLAVLTEQDGNMEKMLLIGLLPTTEGKIPKETTNGNTFILTEKFRLWINDNDNNLVVDALDDGEILLGDKDVKESLILGDSWKKFMQDFITTLASTTVSTGIGQMPLLNATQIAEYTSKLDDLLSKKVKTK